MFFCPFPYRFGGGRDGRPNSWSFFKVLYKVTFIGIDYYSRFTITALDALNVCPEYNKFEYVSISTLSGFKRPLLRNSIGQFAL